MPTLTIRPARRAAQLHKINLGATLAHVWRRWCLRWARHRQRTVLRELADDPHLLADIGVTRAEALKEAGRQAWDLTEVPTRRLPDRIQAGYDVAVGELGLIETADRRQCRPVVADRLYVISPGNGGIPISRRCVKASLKSDSASDELDHPRTCRA